MIKTCLPSARSHSPSPGSFHNNCSNWVGCTGSTSWVRRKPAEKAELDQLVDFVPYYSLGNLCIAGKLHRTCWGTFLTLLASMDGSMELIPLGHCSCLCHRQYLYSAILHDSQAAAHEPTINILYPHSHCVKDLCRYWCLGFLAQWILCRLQEPASNYAHQSFGGSGIWARQCCQ